MAEDSTKFTGEIRAVIDDLKSKSQTAVEKMEEVGKIVGKQNDQSELTMSKFNEIELAVEKSREIVEKINENSTTIYDKNTDIVSVIQNLSAIAEENAATTEEAAASVTTQVQNMDTIAQASVELAGIAEVLQESVDKFTL